MLKTEKIEALAESLWQARVKRAPRAPLTEEDPGMTIEDAYAISRRVFERRLREGGEKAVGRKIGLTSTAVQKQLGVDQPDFGYLTSKMLVENGGTIDAAQLIQARAEGEVAFVLSKGLAREKGGPAVTMEEVLTATDHVIACIEVIDSRVRDWKIKIQDTVADNASSALFVMGSEKRKPSELDLRMAGMALWKNGEVESTGMGAACLGHPALAVAWLANEMNRLGDPLKEGDLILSGAYGPVIPFAKGDRCEVAIRGLGKVGCRFI